MSASANWEIRSVTRVTSLPKSWVSEVMRETIRPEENSIVKGQVVPGGGGEGVGAQLAG